VREHVEGDLLGGEFRQHDVKGATSGRSRQMARECVIIEALRRRLVMPRSLDLLALASAAFAAFAAGGCSSSDGGAALCKGVTPQCIGLAAGSSEAQVQAAFVQITEGGTIVFGAGTFSLMNGLSLATKNVTVKGQGMDVTILDFSKQAGGSPTGIYDNRDGFTLEDLTVQNTFGDAVKLEGSTGVTFQRVHVQWQSTDLPNHGAYGLYPVQCTNVLIQDCKVEGASDSGVYVGQSNQIVVRRNTVDQN